MYTKGKWEVKETLQNDRDKIFFHTSIICGGIRVAKSSGIGEESAIANAERICQCVNNFDELLAECKVALTRLQTIEKDKGIHSFETIPDLQAVIAKAENQG
jgi:hypothetical protein